MRAFLTKQIERARALWRAALAERATPREIGLAVALGVFVACSPAIWFHGVVALALATALRLNRLWAFLGSRVSPIFILPWILLAEVQTGHLVASGGFLRLSRDEIFAHKGELVVHWILGWLIFGSVVSSALGFCAYLVALKRRRARLRQSPSGSTP